MAALSGRERSGGVPRAGLASRTSGWRRGGVAALAGGESGGGGMPSFLTREEAGVVEMASGLDMHEKFLARITISSLNLLRTIAAEEGVPIGELNAGRVTDW